MTFKSTVTLTRDEAESRYVDLIIKHGNPAYFIWQALDKYDNDELSSNLEQMNDQANEGEGFENYVILDEE